MDPENTDAPEVLETQETAEETAETPDEETIELSATELADLRAKAEKSDDLEAKNKQLFERLKKEKQAPSKTDGISNKDVLFLAKADVHSDDMDELLDWAKFKKVSVEEAHKQLKTTLDVRAEERRSAGAAHVKGGARGSSKVSGQDLLRKAEQTGEIPDTADGLHDLFAARMARRLE